MNKYFLLFIFYFHLISPISNSYFRLRNFSKSASNLCMG